MVILDISPRFSLDMPVLVFTDAKEIIGYRHLRLKLFEIARFSIEESNIGGYRVFNFYFMSFFYISAEKHAESTLANELAYEKNFTFAQPGITNCIFT